MIQVCSRCGTRWNVRDRQREWCPRCQGSLLAPTAEVQPDWAARPSNAAQPGASGSSQRLPAGYRWIAVRPGAPPAARQPRRPLGPTPRYASIPRWGLHDQFDVAGPTPQTEPSRASALMVRVTLMITLFAFAFAVVVHLARYALLLYNRSKLLNPIVAGVATWLGVVASVLAFFALIATVVVLTNWLISRRAVAYAHHDLVDPRPVWALWLGCLLPVANLFWAPVFVIELARFEGRLTWLRTPIVVWWCGWWVSFLVSAFAFATSFAQDAQGIANNTVATTVAYLTALAALLLTLRMQRGFEHTAVDRPVTRWVVAAEYPADDQPEPRDAEPETTPRVESAREEPAA